MSAEIIPFPTPEERKAREMENVLVEMGDIPEECTDVIHVFNSVPGHCQCGKNFWDPPVEPVSS